MRRPPTVIPLPDVASARDFEVAARLVLTYLRAELPMAFWSVTRVENGRQTYLYLDDDNGYGLSEGGSHPWAASFCVRMVAGLGPTVAPDAQAVPAYAEAAVNDAVTIRSYAGAPVREPDGALFGAICGIDPDDRVGDERFEQATPTLQLLGQLLTMSLQQERLRVANVRALELARADAERDLLSGCANRNAWERLLAEEQVLLRRLADPTVVVVVDLDGLKATNDDLGHAAGDALIRRCAHALRSAGRAGDVVARVGGDEFVVLARGCDADLAPALESRLRTALEESDVSASLGWAAVVPGESLFEAQMRADEAMYADKHRRRGAA